MSPARRRSPPRRPLPSPRSAGAPAGPSLDIRPAEPEDRGRSSRCCSVRSAATAIPAIPSCSRGSTTRTGSARRRCGWPPTAGEWWLPGVHALGVRPRRQGAASRACGRHRHRSRLPGPRPVPGDDDARPRVGEGRRRRLRVQHPERPEPPRLPQDGLARGRPACRRRCGSPARPGRCGRCGRGCRPIVGRPNSTSACRCSTGSSTGGPAGRLAAPADVREIRTNVDDEFLAWRFGTPLLGYRVVDDGDSAVIVRARMRGGVEGVGGGRRVR